MRHAGHRDVEILLVIERRQRDLVEAVDVDDQIERLPDGQEVRENQELLWLFVAFMSHAERNQCPRLEELVLPKILEQTLDTDLTKPHSHGATEDPDDELVAGSDDGEVVRRDEPEVVGGDASWLAALGPEIGRHLERDA